LAINDSFIRHESKSSFDLGAMNLDKDISEGTKRKAEALLRLK